MLIERLVTIDAWKVTIERRYTNRVTKLEFGFWSLPTNIKNVIVAHKGQRLYTGK